MSKRSSLMAILTALYLGSRIPADLRDGPFYALLGVGWAAVLIWTIIAWRRGELVFMWQNGNR
jgi:hypothetical protein